MEKRKSLSMRQALILSALHTEEHKKVYIQVIIVKKSHFFIINFTKIINTDKKLKAIINLMRKNAQRR